MIFNIKVDDDEFDLNNFCHEIKRRDVVETAEEMFGFDNKLNVERNKIDKINSDVWKKVRWYINNYDFLVKEPIINRAFYKYWEIINVFNIFSDFKESDMIFHCAEAPGGFIQGTNTYFKLNSILQEPRMQTNVDSEGFTLIKKYNKKKDYRIYTISLNKNLSEYRNYNLPSYNKKVINKMVCVTYGMDNTGDINNLNNIKYIKNQMNSEGSYLITADGGFDEGTDFNNKEQLHYLLILNEIYSAISLQKKGGHFILKVFDIFTLTSINLLYLLNIVYSNVFIYKPKTSRPTNSEKYIICKDFNITNENRNIILCKLERLSKELKETENKYKYNSFVIFNSIPLSFIERIKIMNTKLLDTQYEHLRVAINYCKNEEFIKNYELNLSESYEIRNDTFNKWQNEYNIKLP